MSELHKQQLAVDEVVRPEIDQRRAELIRAIDEWIARVLPPSLGCARLHTETVGAVIDRLAEFSASAFVALANPRDGEPFIAWERLAELAVAFEDLTDELSSGRRRLPCAP
ncbi:DUF4254 domain-containing protein [Nocardia uniformis]|uniref:DUF4254 domain-containing protein n=1 Tax=Nocardia uniformis TaxID=53432 RepID=UPI001FE024DE|nr:DUF4254 domain-containing protein [Nocardia uniformis]